jgi:omega-6 fatty acid desaturase (delta-12 desaturase)
LINTLGPFSLVWYLMYRSLAVSYWMMLPLTILEAGLLVRVFIIFHDCGHGSFFKARWANDMVGFVAGMVTFTPYYHWRWEHALHHGSSGNLDRRGSGDVWTLTVQEYLASSRWKRFSYRLARNPVILFLIAPLFLLVVVHRFCSSAAQPRERRSVYWMNLAIFGMACTLIAVFGIKAYLLIQLSVMAVGGGVGVWLFYVQHQFDGVYWGRGNDWDYTAAALQGSSYYKLPKILQWFTGNIGFHHIHHLSPRIPNYNLQKCHDADPLFRQVKPLTLLSSLKSLPYRLWDERRKQLVGYRYLRLLQKHRGRSDHIGPHVGE